jgi:Carboxypeptidase regulatory-like domain
MHLTPGTRTNESGGTTRGGEVRATKLELLPVFLPAVFEHSMKKLTSAVLLLALSFSGVLHAQSQGLGTLTGTVVDATTKAPLSDVLVTVRSPQLQGEQHVKSDSTGTYLVPQLPPGAYALCFEKEGYRKSVESPISVDADRMLRVNVRLNSENTTVQ